MHSQHDSRTGAFAGPLAELDWLVQQALWEEYAPAAVVIDRKRIVQYFWGPVDRYLHFPVEQLPAHLGELLRYGLRGKVRQAIERVFHNGRPMTQEARVKRGGKYRLVRFTVQPLPGAEAWGQLLLVTFIDLSSPASPANLHRKREEQARSLHQYREQLRQLAAELTQAEQRERRRLAEILHDHIQQLLVAAKLQLGLARSRQDREAAGECLQEVDSLLQQCIEAARSLAVELSPPILYRAGLAAALEWLTYWVHEKYRLIVELQSEISNVIPAGETSAFLFQAVRELLFNVVKHSRVDRARLLISEPAVNWIRLTVEDAGIGFDPDPVLAGRGVMPSFGLFHIRERLELLGGRMELESRPGQGTRISLLAPMELPNGQQNAQNQS